MVVKDPVCGMQVASSTAPATSDYRDKTYYFCSRACKEAFDKAPDKYASRSAS